MSLNTNKATLLIVDDTPDNLSLMSSLLKEFYQVKIATRGETALQFAESEHPPNLILLDIMMPGMNGYEVCRRLKSSPKTHDIPVIFVSAKNENHDEQMGLELGAVDYITKPISPPILLARVKNHLALSERTQLLHKLSLQLSHYLPPQICESIFQGTHHTSVKSERKKLTILFSDIKDFTATTENLQPEDLTYLLNQYFSEMSKIATDYGATIDKFIGDAIMIFFGDPETRGIKEDALRCVKMAIAMQRRMIELQMLWRDKGYEQPFQIRIGINTGFCNVGNFGSDQRMDYTIIGAEVNLTARLEQEADAGGIMLSYETYSLVRDQIDADERPLLRVKGISREIRPFAVSGILAGYEQTRRVLYSERRGMKLSIDLDRLALADRATTVQELQEAIRRLTE